LLGREGARQLGNKLCVVLSVQSEQVLDAAGGVGDLAKIETRGTPTNLADDFNVCKTDTVPPREVDDAATPLLEDVLVQTPVPALASGLGQMPRFRAELGPFVGVSSAIRAGAISGGYGGGQETAGASGGLEINVRVGLGLEGVMNESGDGLVFLDAGLRLDAPSSNKIGDTPSTIDAGAITSAIPGRTAFNLRLRMPFWLLPLDLLIAGPFVLIASPTAFANMAVAAGNGGLIPWQTGIATSIGRFQFILGREIGASFYGYGKTDDRLLVPSEGASQTNYTLIGLRSIKFDFPILEYRPFRTFSLDQSTNLLLQFYAGLDVPTRVDVIAPSGARKPDLQPIWEIGLRLVFDWRYYW